MGNQREKNSTHVHMVSANPRLCVQILKFMFFMQAIWFLCPAHQNGLGSTAEDRHDSSTRQQTAEETTDDSNENHHLGGGVRTLNGDPQNSPSCNLCNILNREPNSLGWFYQFYMVLPLVSHGFTLF